jgi:hypothetical protein
VGDLSDSRSDFILTRSRQTGDYRRPLDPGATTLTQVSAQSWKGLNRSAALIGRVLIDQERLDPGSPADATEPYSSDPLVTIDTSGAPVRRNRVVLEGAAGWRAGPWGFGVTAGYAARENSSIVAQVARRTHEETPGAVLGVAKRVGTIAVGAYARILYQTESVRLLPVSGVTTAYELVGFAEVPPLEIGRTAYYRRREENANSFGANLSGSKEHLRWSFFAQIDYLHDRFWRQQVDQPAKDKWDASGWTAGGAWQWSWSSRWIGTMHARWRSINGQADLALDTLGTFFAANERSAQIELELRRLGSPNGWSGGGMLGYDYQRRDRQDPVRTLATLVSSSTPWLGLEGEHGLGKRLSFEASVAMSLFGPTTTLPNPLNQGPVYQSYAAPELDVSSRSAHSTALSWRFQYRTRGLPVIWTSFRWEHLAPNGAALSVFSPPGTRTAVTLNFGITIAPREQQ